VRSEHRAAPLHPLLSPPPPSFTNPSRRHAGGGGGGDGAPLCVAHAAKGAPSLLALSVYEAFYKHHPLKLNANVVWVTIAQGVARFIAADSEAYRAKFVSFSGKKELEFVDLPATSPADANYTAGIASFAEQIGKFIGAPALELFSNSFSNTAPNDAIASQVTLMDAMQAYFDYTMLGGCGIPCVRLRGDAIPRAHRAANTPPHPPHLPPKRRYIELEGSAADWAALRAKGEALRAFDVEMSGAARDLRLGKWLDELLPVLDKLREAACGAPDRAFFGAVCNAREGSAGVGAPVTGWVTVFYPFDHRGRPTQAYAGWRGIYEHTRAAGGADGALAVAVAAEGSDYSESFPHPPAGVYMGCGLNMEEIPTGLSQAPVTFKNLHSGRKWPLRFLAGPATMHQSPADGALEVRCGWAIVETAAKKE
jgi:hypothetical protein